MGILFLMVMELVNRERPSTWTNMRVESRLLPDVMANPEPAEGLTDICIRPVVVVM